MARSKSKQSRTRVTNANSRPSRRFNTDLLDPFLDGPDLRLIEDRRIWHPDPWVRPARRSDGRIARLQVPVERRSPTKGRLPSYVTQNFHEVSHRVGFEKPRGVTICERRTRRREVLFARKKTGQSGQKKPRWSEFSTVQCKRRK